MRRRSASRGRRRSWAAFLGCALCAVPAAGEGASAESWIKVAEDDAFFEAWLPDPPEPAERTNLTAIGRTHSTGHRLDREGDGCEIWINELPAALRWLGGESWAYEGARKSLLEEAKARQRSFDLWRRDGVEGRALEWESDRATGRAEIYALSGTLYLFTCYARGGASRALLDGFFERLSLRPR